MIGFVTSNSKVRGDLRSHLARRDLRVTISAKTMEGAMRWFVSIGAALVAVAMGSAAGAATSSPASPVADSKDNRTAVDIELIIAVDVSYSMDLDELAVQREG